MERIQKQLAIDLLQSQNKMRIQTKHKREEVVFKEEFPLGWSDEARVERALFKYYCPICLRYFNQILVSSCCNNYICRHCIGDQAQKAFADSSYTINCNHCRTDKFLL